MKILAVSDKVVSRIYSPLVKDVYEDVDLVIGCGDLPFYYLEHIVTLLNVPVLYVHGNHDKPTYREDGKEQMTAEGCDLLEDRTLVVNGLIFAGLGGSMRYHPDAPNQYSEYEMRNRVIRLVPRLLYNKMKYGRYLDVLVTHSPPLGIHDGDDLPHKGFQSLVWLLERFKPRYMIHGHQHVYRNTTITETRHHETTIVNVYPMRVFEWEVEEFGEAIV